VRKATEARDDVAMLARRLDGLRVEREALAQRRLLVGQHLGVHEGQVEEDLEIRSDALVEPGLQGLAGEEEGERIGRVHVACAAEAVARELVEHDEERQHVPRRQRPGIELAPRRGKMRVEEQAAETVVEGGVLLEPFLRARLGPE